jgi:hypothetical protein
MRGDDRSSPATMTGTEWAEWGTSIGTLVLAVATFASVRSANRSARIAEQALLVGTRPLLVGGRPDEAGATVQYADGRRLAVPSGDQALVSDQDGVVYLALLVRNAGAGFAVIEGYRLQAESADEVAGDPAGAARHRRGDPSPAADEFHVQQRDIFVAPGDSGIWQAALRDPAGALEARTRAALATRGRLTVDVLYADQQGDQRSATRFVLLARDDGGWSCDVARHWRL